MDKPALSTRQAQIAEYVARAVPNRVIAHETGMDIETIRVHIKRAAAKIPGDGTPRHKLVLWFFNISD